MGKMKELYTELEENNKDNWADADLHYATEQMKEDDAKEKREPSCLNKTKTEEEVDTNEKQAYKLYTQGGQGLVYDYVNEGKLKYDKWGYCEPCEWESPIYRGDCLVCGSIYKESEVANDK